MPFQNMRYKMGVQEIYPDSPLFSEAAQSRTNGPKTPIDRCGGLLPVTGEFPNKPELSRTELRITGFMREK